MKKHNDINEHDENCVGAHHYLQSAAGLRGFIVVSVVLSVGFMMSAVDLGKLSFLSTFWFKGLEHHLAPKTRSSTMSPKKKVVEEKLGACSKNLQVGHEANSHPTECRRWDVQSLRMEHVYSTLVGKCTS